MIWEFRPLPNYFENCNVRRYAEGLWLPDDGKYDLAFIGTVNVNADGGFPVCLYFEEGRENVLCKWVTNSYWDIQPKHPNSNAWHYALKTGATEWGDSIDFNNTPNSIAKQSGMNKMSSEKGCCNGHSVEFKYSDPHITAGLLRNGETKEVFEWPKDLTCMYCGETPHTHIVFGEHPCWPRLERISELSKRQQRILLRS